MNKPPLTTSERLKNGAALLGRLWRLPEQRCTAGWSLDNCTCQPKKKFCEARELWIELALSEPEGHDFEEGLFGLGIAMRASEWDLTGLQMKIQHSDPAIGLMVIGSSPECVSGMSYIAMVMDAPEGLASTLRVLKTFPRSKVHGIVQAEKIAVAVVDTFEAEAEPEILANPDEAFESNTPAFRPGFPRRPLDEDLAQGV